MEDCLGNRALVFDRKANDLCLFDCAGSGILGSGHDEIADGAVAFGADQGERASRPQPAPEAVVEQRSLCHFIISKLHNVITMKCILITIVKCCNLKITHLRHYKMPSFYSFVSMKL